VVQPSKDEVEGINNKLKVEVARPGKDEFEDIDSKSKVLDRVNSNRSTDKRFSSGHVAID
jgi:hypothetical protein